MDKSKSFNLLIVSLTLLVLTFILAGFWNSLGFGKSKMILGLLITVCFGISVAGLILGNAEKKIKSNKKWIGIIGNMLIVLFFVVFVIYAILHTS